MVTAILLPKICVTDSDLRVFDRVVAAGMEAADMKGRSSRAQPCARVMPIADYEVPTAAVSISPEEALLTIT